MSEPKTTVTLSKATLSRWSSLLAGTENDKKMAQFEIIFETDKFLATSLVPPAQDDGTFTCRDFNGETFKTDGQIAAIKEIRARTGWGLLLSKYWVDQYGQYTQSVYYDGQRAEQIERANFHLEPDEARDEHDMPF